MAAIAIAVVAAAVTASGAPWDAAAASPSPGAESSPTVAPTLVERPAGELQALVDAASPGDVIDVPAGRYREQVVVRVPVTLQGAAAEIRGSDVWTDWAPDGARWVSTLTVPEFYTGGTCEEPRCSWPEQVFLDGAPLLQVGRDPASGQFAIDGGRRVVLGDDPGGRLVEVTMRQHWVLAEAADVTLEGFTMRQAASPAQFGGIHAGAGGDRLTIRDATLSDTHGALVSFHDNAGGRLEGSVLERGGQIGVKGGGEGVSDLAIIGNRISGSNTEGFETGWESGGIKLTDATKPVIEDNEVFDNIGPGIWCDIDCTDATITGNHVHDNTRAGIMFEISQGALIEGNTVDDNGWGFATWGWGAGILVSSASGATVRDNTVAWNADGIAVISQERGRPSGDPVRDNEVTGNLIAGGPDGAYLLAWLEDWPSGMFDAEAGNEGLDNRFWIAPDSEHDCQYIWKDCVGSVEDFAATPGGQGSTTLAGTAAATELTDAGLASPRPHELHDPPRLRQLVVPIAIGALLAVAAIAILVAILVRRRRRSAA